MSTGRKIFGALAAIVCIFYAFESFLVFQASGFTVPLLIKVGICLATGWYAWTTFRPSKSSDSGSGSAV